MIPFFANKRFHPRLNLNIFQAINSKKAYNIAKHMEDILKQLLANLLIFQKAQKNAANFHQMLASSYELGDQVWLNTCNIRTQKLSKKLDNKWISLFLVQDSIGKRAYWLKLPATIQIHPVFYVSLFCPAAQNLISG